MVGAAVWMLGQKRWSNSRSRADAACLIQPRRAPFTGVVQTSDRLYSVQPHRATIRYLEMTDLGRAISMPKFEESNVAGNP